MVTDKTSEQCAAEILEDWIRKAENNPKSVEGLGILMTYISQAHVRTDDVRLMSAFWNAYDTIEAMCDNAEIRRHAETAVNLVIVGK